MESPVTKVLREGKIAALANRTILIGRTGTERPIEDSGAPIIDNAQLVGVVLVFRDACQQRNEERRFVALANTISQLAWTNTVDDIYEYFNRGWYLHTGMTEAEPLRPDLWARVVHPQDFEHTRSAWMHAIATGEPHDVECPLSGTERSVGLLD